MITKEDYIAYEKVRLSGKTNMFDVPVVQVLSGLTREKIIEIMEHFSELMEKYPDVRGKV